MPKTAYLPFGIRICVAELEQGGGEADKTVRRTVLSLRESPATRTLSSVHNGFEL